MGEILWIEKDNEHYADTGNAEVGKWVSVGEGITLSPQAFCEICDATLKAGETVHKVNKTYVKHRGQGHSVKERQDGLICHSCYQNLEEGSVSQDFCEECGYSLSLPCPNCPNDKHRRGSEGVVYLF